MSTQPARSYLTIAAAIVVAGLLISVSLFFVVGGTKTTTITAGSSTTTTTSSAVDCADPGAPYGVPANAGIPLIVGNNLYQCERVLIVPPGTNGTLVVSYETDLNSVVPPSAGGSEIANFTADILAPDWSRVLTIPQQYSYVNATGVTITPSVRSVNVTALGNATRFTVTYTVKVSKGVSGFFMLQYLDACPTMIPLAVGYSASQLNASSFPDYQPFLQGCTQLGMLPGGTLISVSGIQTAWLVQTIQQGNNLSTASTTTGETCTPNATITQGSTTEIITLCHTVSTTYAPPSSSSSTTNTASSATVTNPRNGLELRLSVNASTSATGVNASVSVDAYNPSSSPANVTSADDYVVHLNGTEGAICGADTYAQNPTVGFAIAEGRYTSSNVTEAKLLVLVNPNVAYNCPLYLGYGNPTGFLFQPMSDVAASYGCNQQVCMSGDASTGVTSSGYWNQGGAFISFPKGTYTVFAEDEWGDLVLAYFTVS